MKILNHFVYPYRRVGALLVVAGLLFPGAVAADYCGYASADKLDRAIEQLEYRIKTQARLWEEDGNKWIANLWRTGINLLGRCKKTGKKDFCGQQDWDSLYTDYTRLLDNIDLWGTTLAEKEKTLAGLVKLDHPSSDQIKQIHLLSAQVDAYDADLKSEKKKLKALRAKCPSDTVVK